MATANFKTAVKAYGRQIAFQCTINGTVYGASSIIEANPHYDGALFKTVLKCLDLELDTTGDFKGQLITAPTFSVTAPGITTPQTKTYGTYKVKEQTTDKDKASVKLECYDLMIDSMVPYDLDLDYTGGVTVLGLLTAICARLGWTLGSSSFTNSNVRIPREMYDNSVTFRDALDDIAGVACGTLAFKGNTLYMLYPVESGETITPDIVKTMAIGDAYGPVNALVLSREPQEDNIYISDDESIALHGKTEVKISNNQLIEAWRVAAEESADSTADTVKANMFTRLNGLSFYLYDITSFGIVYLDILDRFTLADNEGATYSTILLSDNLKITQGLDEEIELTAPEETETDYTAASKTDRVIDQTILRVDKQEGAIEELITKTANTENSVSGLTETVTNALGRLDTAESSIITISQTVENGATKVVTETGFTFDKDGLKIRKTGEEMESLVDNTGLYVNRGYENILTASATGVNALNLTSRKYLVIGHNSRFEDYQGTRTACFYIGG